MRNFLTCLLILCAVAILGGCSSRAQTAANTADWSWTAPTTFADGTTIPSADTITYNLYVGTAGKGSEASTPVQTGITGVTVTTFGYAAGSVVCGEVTSVVNSVESARSNEACKSFPDLPSTPVNLTVK